MAQAHAAGVGKVPPIAGQQVLQMRQRLGCCPDAQRFAVMHAHVALRSNNRDVQARLCLQGAGVCVLPRPLGDSLPGLERLDLGEDPPGRDTWLGYHRDLRRLARLRALIDFVVARLAS